MIKMRNTEKNCLMFFIQFQLNGQIIFQVILLALSNPIMYEITYIIHFFHI